MSLVLLIGSRYLGTSFEDNTVSIFMQFVPGGSIASILARFGALDEAVFRRYTRQILQGVEYLHNNDVIHRLGQVVICVSFGKGVCTGDIAISWPDLSVLWYNMATRWSDM